jgi:hypothetical protein
MGQLVQIAGALAVLAGFVLAQARVLSPRSRRYLTLNLVGSGVLALDAWLHRQWGFLLLEAVWAVVSAWGLFSSWRRPRCGGRTTRPVAAPAAEGPVQASGVHDHQPGRVTPVGSDCLSGSKSPAGTRFNCGPSRPPEVMSCVTATSCPAPEDRQARRCGLVTPPQPSRSLDRYGTCTTTM